MTHRDRLTTTDVETLCEENARLRDFAELSSDWFWETGPDHRFTFFSSDYEARTGNAPKNLIGLARWEIAADIDDEDKWLRHRATLEAHLPFRDFEYRIDAPGGDRGWRRISGKPIRGAAGDFLGYRGIARDISEIKRTQQELEISEQRLLDAIQTISEGFVLFDKDERLILCNENFIDTAPFLRESSNYGGITFEEFLRRAVDGGYIDNEGLQDDADRWIAERLQRHRSPNGVAFEQKLRDGRWLRVYEKRTIDGGVVGVRTDITELKHAEQLLLDAFESAGIGIAVFDADDRLLLRNSAYCDIWRPFADRIIPGVSFQDLCGWAWDHGLVLDADTNRTAWINRRIVEHRSGGATVDRRLAASRWIRIVERPTTSAGVVSILSDISELKRQQAEIQNFAYSVTHDLKTPLRAIISFAEVIRSECRDTLSDDAAEYLEDILSGSNRMAELLNDLLEYSTFGERRFRREPLDLQVLVAEQIRLRSGPAAGIGLQTRLSGDAPVVLGDRTVLSQVFQNLIDNAIKFTPADRVPDLDIAIIGGDPFVTVHITDNGIGISEKFSAQIFDIFKRLHADDAYPGTGLGLSIVKKGVELHDGYVDVTPAPGGGSTFSVHLPTKPFAKGPYGVR